MRYILAVILIAGLLVGCDDSTTTQALLPVASTTISAANPTSEPAPIPDPTPDPTATPTSEPTAIPTLEPTVTNAGTKIAFVSNRDGDADIYVMDADGGNVRQLTNAPGWDGTPAWSPDGTKIAFVSNRDGDADIYVMDADGGNVRKLTEDDYPADMVSYEVQQGDTLWAIAKKFGFPWSPEGMFDLVRINDLTDEKLIFPGQVLQIPPFNPDYHRLDSNPSWSPDGTRIVFSGSRRIINKGDAHLCHFSKHWVCGSAHIYVVDVDGRNLQQLTHDAGWHGDRQPAWSPDGTQIAFTSHRDGGTDIFVMDADGGNLRQLTDNLELEVGMSFQILDEDCGMNLMRNFVINLPDGCLDRLQWDRNPAWSPDGRLIAFDRTPLLQGHLNRRSIFVMDADGENVRRVTDDPVEDRAPAWSADGTKIAFVRWAGIGWGDDIYIMDADGSNVRQLTDTPDRESNPAWSPVLPPRT